MRITSPSSERPRGSKPRSPATWPSLIWNHCPPSAALKVGMADAASTMKMAPTTIGQKVSGGVAWSVEAQAVLREVVATEERVELLRERVADGREHGDAAVLELRLAEEHLHTREGARQLEGVVLGEAEPARHLPESAFDGKRGERRRRLGRLLRRDERRGAKHRGGDEEGLGVHVRALEVGRIG